MIANQKQIQKRDGRCVLFDENKILTALQKAFEAVGRKDGKIEHEIKEEVVRILDERYFNCGMIPQVEEVQDQVEKVLIEKNEFSTAKAYILYREKRAEMRDIGKNLLEENFACP